MWTKGRAVLAVVVVVAGLVAIAPQVARAGGAVELCNDLITHPDPDSRATYICWWIIASLSREAAVARPVASTQRMFNVGATLQAGEPTAGGLMTRTVWTTFTAPAAGRIVMHTFGSELWEGDGVFDTVLAAYRGTAFGNLVRVALNDNTPLSGIANRHSLIQFDIAKGARYWVQIGSRKQAEGVASLNAFRFPPAGGLSAFLIHVGGNTANPANGSDYTCDFFTGPSVTTTCQSAKFIVHNSMDVALAVKPSSTLGAGVSAQPATFMLAPGALKVVTFTFGAGFNSTAVRTDSGHFVLTGRRNGAVVTQARHRALVVARPGTPVQNLIDAVATPPVKTGHVNEPLDFVTTVSNKGSETAVGCHVRATLGGLKATFYEINRNTGARLGADNEPVDIPAGEDRTFKVRIASQSARDADYIDPEVIADCANNQRTQWGLRSGFDISASNLSVSANAAPLPSLAVTAASPPNVLNVPASGVAYFKFRATNRGARRMLTALPAYVRPFDDVPDTAFTVAICRTNLSTGACIGGYASSVTYTATANATVGFSVRVTPPAGSPAYDPDKRRVYVNFKLADAPYFHIAAPSVAVRKQ